MAMSNKQPERIPQLLRGSLVTLRRRCGKPSCRCADGEQLHEAPALSYSQDGRTRMLTLTDADVPGVTAALERYRLAQSELAGKANAGLVALANQIAADRAAGRRPRRGR
ncbi:MAG: DUF6788 family protein [Dermatophilaceae bacterium]